MELFGKINSRQDELFIKALCYDLKLDYNVIYDKFKVKWFVLKELSENQYWFILRSADDYFLMFEKDNPTKNSSIKISA